ncbi:hypothetical protein E4T48_00229 [Aureobasidium sp. EXF-10727]|nr:hypothetical protein E4T48_00229 [Aureobasidium sp. EXF-10727]
MTARGEWIYPNAPDRKYSGKEPISLQPMLEMFIENMKTRYLPPVMLPRILPFREFLIAMAPQLRPLARSDSKAKLFQRLGLSLQNSADNLLRDEAILGRERILSSPNSLLPQLRGDPSVQPPYSNVQICESAVHNEILRIYREASAETKSVYEKGHDTESFNEENWIIRWMLCEFDCTLE